MATTTVKAKMKTLATMATPDGIAAYPKLTRPDTAFDKNQFRILVAFDKKDPKYVKFLKVVSELNTQYLDSIGKRSKRSKKLMAPKSIKTVDEKMAKITGWTVGQPYIEFSQKPDDNETPIPVFGADARSTDKRVFGTDLVSIETRVVGWETSKGAGLKFYLVSVQLLESRWQGTTGSSFGTREEYITDENDESEDATGDDPDESGFEEEDIGDFDDGEKDEDDASGGLV